MSFPVAAHWPWPIGAALYSTPFTQQYKTDTFFFSLILMFSIQYYLFFQFNFCFSSLLSLSTLQKIAA